jgi:transposase
MGRRHISREIKEAALSMTRRGLPDADIEEHLGISARTMRRLRETFRITGNVVRIPVCPGRPRLLDGLDARVSLFAFSITSGY